MASTRPISPPAAGRRPPQRPFAERAALVVGAAFLAIGVAGFIPGLTTNYGELTWAGHHSEAELLGVFQVSVLHNLVHVAFGVAGLAAARSARWSIRYLLGGGVAYLVLAVYGFVVDDPSDANLVPVNAADDWLHLVLGLAMVVLGAAGQRDLDPQRSERLAASAPAPEARRLR